MPGGFRYGRAVTRTHGHQPGGRSWTANDTAKPSSWGCSSALGLALLGHFIAKGVVSFRALDRTVNAKGLAEREVDADVAIWPIRFDLANNDLAALTVEMEKKTALVRNS